MATITKPIILDETGQAIKEAIENLQPDNSSVVTINGSSISLKQWITNCESGVYTSDNLGTIATITNLINGKAYRVILIGINHDVLADTDLGELEPNGTKAKTTWQFYDMPIYSCNLGLPFQKTATGYIRTNQTVESGEMSTVPNISEITINENLPSNMHGYPSAVQLLDTLQSILKSMPYELQKAIKLVRKDIFISEVDDGDNYENFDSTGTMIRFEQDRYGSRVYQKLFCLSAAECGITSRTDNYPDYFPITASYDNGGTETLVNLEGYKYEYMVSSPMNNQSSETMNKLIRYYNGAAQWYWLRSPYLDRSYYWGSVNYGGDVGIHSTNFDGGVAPAFCI